jgi:hypothetical protein
MPFATGARIGDIPWGEEEARGNRINLSRCRMLMIAVNVCRHAAGGLTHITAKATHASRGRVIRRVLFFSQMDEPCSQSRFHDLNPVKLLLLACRGVGDGALAAVVADAASKERGP